ncbi:MAG: ABC transporter ATP-binding protein [Gammaproteobacteria bacterium]|nr:ABC transporter ATP-binding protein [Gammaproteobacteria bacterium]
MKESRVLEVQMLSVDFSGSEGNVRAVSDAAFYIDIGETLALVGESGSGKSVTALSLTRLIEYEGGRIVSGRITLRKRDGSTIDVMSSPLPVLRAIRGYDVAYIFQDPMTSLNPVYTIGQQIGEAIRLHQRKSAGDTRKLALEMLERVRIPDAAAQLARYPHQLSGGMRQRVMIAMALCSRPALLIADEPTTALDVTIQAQILDLIRSLQEEMNMAVLFITHDMGVVAQVADRVAVMRAGRVVECGAIEAIFQRPAEAYTRSLLNAIPRLGSMSGKPGPEKFFDGGAPA